MAKLLKLRRGTTSQHSSFTGAEGEVTVDTTKDTAVIHDGSTAGGRPLLREDLDNMPASGVSAGTYGSSSAIPAITVDAKGRVTSATTSAIDSTAITNGTSNVSVANNSNITFVNAGSEKARVDSQGFLFGDNDKARFGDGGDLEIQHNGSHSFIVAGGVGDLFVRNTNTDKDIVFTSDDGSGGNADYMRCDGANGKVRLYHYGTEKLQTKSDGVDIQGEVQCDSLDVDGSADISSNLNVSGNTTFHGNVDLHDNDKLRLGTGDDLQIFHSGSESFIADEGTGGITISGGVLSFKNQSRNETFATMTVNGAVDLYHDNQKKLATKSDGIDVTGEVQCDSLDVDGAGDVSGNLAVGGNITVSGTVDGRDVASDGSKLDGIATGANNITNNNQLTNGAGYITASQAFTSGMIVMFTGTTAPSGWAICNGSNGTPDLRNRFIVGQGSTYNINATGGSANANVVSHSHNISDPGHNHNVSDPGHNHNVSDPGHNHTYTRPNYENRNPNVGSNSTSHSTSNANTGNRTTGISIGNRTTGISIGNRTTGINIASAGSSGNNKNLPPYYALAFIMKL